MREEEIMREEEKDGKRREDFEFAGQEVQFGRECRERKRAKAERRREDVERRGEVEREEKGRGKRREG